LDGKLQRGGATHDQEADSVSHSLRDIWYEVLDITQTMDKEKASEQGNNHKPCMQ
jgi:hypothetical protein